METFTGLPPFIRFASERDAPSLLSIYTPYVEQTVITFETCVPTVAEFERRIRDIGSVYPYLVYEREGVAAAYAYAAPVRSRAAYQWTAELSVYVREDAHRMGIGRMLYTALLSLLARQNIRIVYAVITTPNAQSECFHESIGFDRVCVFPKCGYKHGAWRDVLWMQKIIGEFDDEPELLRPIGEVITL
jgi:phosphinothricin acetyltransferase